MSAREKAERKAWLHANLPTVAAVVRQFREAFGEDQIQVTYASENGHVLGKKSTDNRSRCDKSQP